MIVERNGLDGSRDNIYLILLHGKSEIAQILDLEVSNNAFSLEINTTTAKHFESMALLTNS